eukprot:scaffold723_cov363-Prasinococcus_capsulatus_cf.AAC.11
MSISGTCLGLTAPSLVSTDSTLLSLSIEVPLTISVVFRLSDFITPPSSYGTQIIKAFLMANEAARPHGRYPRKFDVAAIGAPTAYKSERRECTT